MLWVTWSIPPLVSSLVLVLVVCAFWAAKAQIRRLGLLPVLAALVCALSLAPERTTAVSEAVFAVVSAIVTNPHLDGFVLSHINMIVAGGALVWLLRRALQTLWKPVPELISILGVEVPSPPDVSLTAIGVDKATITWTRPPPNRPVEKYVIQVNGVNVGESATSHDTFITVSGLKPNHFYNVRIIAVSSNNFQAGSRVLRLCTFSPDGRPRLGLPHPPSDARDTASAARQHDTASNDDNGVSGKHSVISTFGIAHALPSDDQHTHSRDGSSSTALSPPSRRNTVNRRHSPSTTSLDLQQLQQLQQQQLQQLQQRGQPISTAPATATADEDTDVTEEQMAELNKRYLNLRKETEDTIASNAKEEADMKRLLEELEAEKQEKRKEHKRKEEQTEKLKREQGATERTMRATLQRRAQKEKKLKEKTDELKRLEDNIEKWEASIQKMREDQLNYDKKKLELEEELQKKGAELREHNASVLADSVRLEAELKEKRRQVKKLEDERKNVDSSAADDAELRLRAAIVELRKQGNRQELLYRDSIRHEHLRQQGLDAHLNVLAKQMQQIPQASVNLYNSHPGALPGAVPGPVSGVVPGTVPGAAPGTVPGTLPGVMPGVLSSNGLPGPMPGAMPGLLSGGLLGTMASGGAVPGSGPGTANPSSMSLVPGFELDHNALQNHAKHRSHTSNSFSSAAAASPLPSFTVTDSNGRPPSSHTPFTIPTRPPTQTGFLTGPFMGPSADHPEFDDAEIKLLTAGAPLSPSATSLLPSKLFLDDDPPSPSPGAQDRDPFSSMVAGSPEVSNGLDRKNNTGSTVDSGSSNKSASNSNAADASSASGGGNDNGNGNGHPGKDPQSPTPSSRSASMFSSPWSSSQNLPFPSYAVDALDGAVSQRNGLPSPTSDPDALARQPANNRGFNSFFSLTRSRGTKALDESGPALGSLKHGQSQSFPRQGDDVDGAKSRRKSLSTLNMFNRNSAGPELVDGHLLPAAGGFHSRSGGFSARSLFPFGSRPSASAFSSHAPSSPRPSSMASIDLPRPSTDSSSIWGPPGENGTVPSGLGKTSRLWSTSETAWPSRNPSRRPSVHGSTPVLKTNLASADDEILDEEELLNPETSPSQVGVIGSRPPAAGKKPPSGLGKTLNPAAPTFMGSLFRPRTDKDKDKGKDKDRGKDKDKDKNQEGEVEKPKAKGKGKGKAKGRQKDQKDSEVATPTGSGALNLTVDEAAASDARMSRDGYSMHTQTSMSESRDSLDYVVSNTTSEPMGGGSSMLLSSSKDSGDNTLFKLFRKESTSKLSFSRRIGRSKGTTTGSMASSDKNPSAGRSSFGDFEDLADETVLSTSGGRGAGQESLGSYGSYGSYGSQASSPQLGPSKPPREGKAEGKLKPPSGSWFSIKKKNRERPSLEMDRDRDRDRDREHRGLGEPESTVSSLATASSKGTETSEK